MLPERARVTPAQGRAVLRAGPRAVCTAREGAEGAAGAGGQGRLWHNVPQGWVCLRAVGSSSSEGEGRWVWVQGCNCSGRGCRAHGGETGTHDLALA